MLIDSNVYQNQATGWFSGVCLLNIPGPSPQRPAGTLRVLVCWQYGGGLYIWGTATLTNTNVYANQAETVCSPFALNFRLAPRWNVTRAHDWQWGGGLYVDGTATLTNTTVYDNQAPRVC